MSTASKNNLSFPGISQIRIYGSYLEINRTPFRFRFAILLVTLLCYFSCTVNTSNNNADMPDSGGEGIYHAGGFAIEESGDFTILSVINPWQGASDLVFRYVLASRDSDTGDELFLDGNKVPVIRTPVSSVICLSTTHIALLDFIDETASIVAVSGGDFIYNSGIRERREQGDLPGIGYDLNLNYERILDLNPEVIFAYGVDAEAAAWLDRLRDLGMNVILIGEYLENSPLAQAEWVKFVARLFEKQDMAAEKFSSMEKEYMQLAGLAAASGQKPVVMSGLPWRNSWFVPGGNSHFARLINDAGGRYLWDNNRGRENFPVDLEKVIEQSATADYWINTGTALSMSDIGGIDKRLTSLRPYRLNNIYNNNARLNQSGGNDYWESGIVNPHLILKDLIHILHPGILPGHEPFYYRQL